MPKEDLEKELADRIEQIKRGEARRYFLGHLDYPLHEKEKDKVEVAKLVRRIKDALPRLKKLIQSIRGDIKSITEQTQISAAYLLLGKAYGNLETVLDLAEQGKNLEVMDVARAGQESVDLVMLFLEDSGRTFLEKWFKGATIKNENARIALHERLNSERTKDEKTLPIKQMSGRMYDIYSKYTHSTYGALLDAVDVYHEDFDFEKFAGFHYSKHNFHVVNNLFSIITLQLKNVFLKLKDPKRFTEADEIYRSMEITRTPVPEMEKIIKKYQEEA